MKPWIKLAWKEFWLPFYYWNWKTKEGCPGGRDFAWLSIFMALILTLMLLLLASREGLLNKFVDVFLGNVPEYGVPISVTNNMLSRGGVNAIDTSVLAEMKKLGKIGNNEKIRVEGIKIHPYRPLEASMHPFIALPGEKIWENKLENGSKIGPDFDGWAVYADDPLWTKSASSKALTMEIIMSRMLFRKYFNYNIYRNILKNELPSEFLKTLPEKLDKTLENPLDVIWIRVTNGFRRELFPCKVKWVDRFPVIDKIAFLLSLSTYHALKAAHDFPELRYFPESEGKGGERIKQILVETDPESNITPENMNRYKELAAKLGNGKAAEHRGDILIKLKYPVQKSWIQAYTKQYKISYDEMETISGDLIKHEKGELILPCIRLPNEYLSDISCTEQNIQPVHLDVTSKGNGFHRTLVYVPDRTLLSTAVDELMKVKDKALSIHPSYQDALNRFGFLSKILAAMQNPYILFLGIFVICFLSIQIGTLIGHRRKNYGMFLAKGMEWWQIYSMLWLQLFLSTLIGILAAYCMIELSKKYLEKAIKPVASAYKETLNIADFNLLPLTWIYYIGSWGLVLIVACALASIILWFMPLKQRTHPAILLQ